jgi:cysteine-rich repeat protein
MKLPLPRLVSVSSRSRLRGVLRLGLVLLAPLVAGVASAVDLLEAGFVAGSSPALTNGASTVRLEAPEIAGLPLVVFAVHVCGDGVLAPAGEECDDGGTAPGDGCSARCRIETFVPLYGTAQGGSVSLVVDDVTITVITLPGMSALQVLEDLAAEINADPTLQGLGTTASVLGGELVTDGVVSSYTILDPGLSDSPPAVPSLGPWGVGALAALLLGVGAHRLQRRAQGASHSARD